ncbi:MAG: hypothetical protein MUE98_13760 [Rhodobacteraceae bacterium]|jgi:hypothetical protein|nr:hypothetical protein [Paracoccaceae bacterium]
MPTEFLDAEVQLLALAEQVLGGRGSVETVRIEQGEDSDGDAALFVTIVVPDVAVLQDSRQLLHLKLRARDRLEEIGRDAFPIFSFVLNSEYDQHAAA